MLLVSKQGRVACGTLHGCESMGYVAVTVTDQARRDTIERSHRAVRQIVDMNCLVIVRVFVPAAPALAPIVCQQTGDDVDAGIPSAVH